MHRTSRLLATLALLAILGGILAPAADAGKGWDRNGLTAPVERHHTGYESVYPSPGSTAYYQDFYVSAYSWHWFQQTYPDNKQCYHRIIHRSTGVILAGAWLWGNGHGSGYEMGVYNNNATSQAMRHSVSGCSGQVQVYNYH